MWRSLATHNVSSSFTKLLHPSSFSSFLSRRTLFSKAKDLATLNRLKEREKEGFTSVMGELRKIHQEEMVDRENAILNRSWKDYWNDKKPQSKVTIMVLLFGFALYVTTDTKAKMQRLEDKLTKELDEKTEKLDAVKMEQVLYATKIRTLLCSLLEARLGGEITKQQKDEIEKEVDIIMTRSNVPEKVLKSVDDDVFY